MKHRIGIDIRMIQNTGIGTYLRGLLDGMDHLPLPLKDGIAFFGKPSISNDTFAKKPHAFSSPIYSIREQIEYPFHVRQCSLWHSPHYNVPVLKGKTKLVVTIHDLIHWIFRKDFFSPLQTAYAQFMLNRAVTSSDHIIAVSGKTKDDLIQHFNADPEKISVLYEGVSKVFRPLEFDPAFQALKTKYHLPDSFFLYVGMLKPHKNVQWLIHLFQKLRKANTIGASLVLIGRKDRQYPVGYETLAKLQSGEGVIHLPQVTQEELVAFYNSAQGLIHPSLYEGFGLTLLEAMACGTPVIACRSASIPEVVGDAAMLVDSCAEKEMIDAIVRIEKFSSVREDYRRKGLLHAAKFRWDDMAQKTLEIYEEVLSQS